MSATTDKIRSRGHWDVVIRPQAFDDQRVPYEELDTILERAVVRFRGWPVPFIDNRKQPDRGKDWIGQDNDTEMVSHYEAWRFFTSGQFNHVRAVSADWREGREATPTPAGVSAIIEVWEILFYLTEVFELAARLALLPGGDSSLHIGVALNGLQGRGLVVGQQNRMEFIEPYLAEVATIDRSFELTRDDLVANPRAQAVEMTREFLLRFGWKPSREQLAEHQLELINSR